MMNRKWIGLLAAVVLTGCDGASITIDLGSLLQPTITLRLVNDTDFSVTPSVFVSDLEDVIIPGLTESLLTLDSNAQNFGDLSPGEERTRVYDCDDFKAVTAEDATLITGIGLDPDDSTQVLIADDDFKCGDTVVITYSGGLLGFDARISVTPNGL